MKEALTPARTISREASDIMKSLLKDFGYGTPMRTPDVPLEIRGETIKLYIRDHSIRQSENKGSFGLFALIRGKREELFRFSKSSGRAIFGSPKAALPPLSLVEKSLKAQTAK